ncbi:MAG TPA: FAD binding domain-containing protein [Actinomycetota bacterium]|nr:FAD binding domain-containing protein [Actinomycetota bacterium]
MDYLVPIDLEDAIEMRSGGLTVLAGGTDVYPAHVGRPMGPVVDISGLSELRGIAETTEGYRIGALTRWADVVAASLPSGFDGLRAAAREVGSVQVQAAGTVGGNLCNASPAADGVPPLLTLDASVELASVSGTRVLALEEFITGYRQTALAPDELLTAVLIQHTMTEARAAFSKLGLRRYLVISIVMVAATMAVDGDGHIQRARVAVGACSPVAQRLPDLEASLVGRLVGEDLGALALPEHLSALAPIDDVRASADYRRDAALTLVRRTLASCAS